MRFCSVVNSHQSYHDVLNVFLLCYRRFLKDIPLYICTNSARGISLNSGEKIIEYQGEVFSNQALYSLLRIDYEIILTFNDDYLVTNYANMNELNRLINLLSKSEYSQIRLVRGPNFSFKEINPHLFELDNTLPYFFSQTLTLWKRHDLIKIYENTPISGIARKKSELQFELLANKTCKNFNIKGLVYYAGSKKKGFHYRCEVIPHLESAVVDGFWNICDYKMELRKIFNFYRIIPERSLGPRLSIIRTLISYWKNTFSRF